MAKQTDQEKVVAMCEFNLFAFAKLINPHYSYGDIHEEVFAWLSDPDANERQLLLLPRGHLKSHCLAVYAVWRITYKPWVSIVYLSAGEDLAKDQIYAIKNMMTSDTYKYYWPEMLNDDEGRREQWSAYSFNVDHPERKRRGIRDHTIIVKTVRSNAIGLHCDELLPDDVVVPVFAETGAGRSEVRRALAQFTSILNPGGRIKAVGTRYHPDDAYQDMIDAEYPIWVPELQAFKGKSKLWDIFQREAESIGNGTGNFIWPRIVNEDTGESYGFDHQILAIIRADYESKGQIAQYYCQYYNDPNAVTLQRIDRNSFQYYDKKHLTGSHGSLKIGGKRLSVFAAMDVAWSRAATADYTAISVIGVDEDNIVYVLDLAQFKTSTFADYYEKVLDLHMKWGFKKIRVETNSGGFFVQQELERYCRMNGNMLTIEGKATVSNEGKKPERHSAALEWRYDAKMIWHFRGGHIPELEDQIILENPKHDDLVDALVASIEISKPPGKRSSDRRTTYVENNVHYDTRFGGRRGRAA